MIIFKSSSKNTNSNGFRAVYEFIGKFVNLIQIILKTDFNKFTKNI
jgi:hypothetical protein